MLLFIISLQADPASIWGIVKDVLGSPAGSFASVLGIVLFLGWLIHYTTAFVTRHKVESDTDRRKVLSLENNIESIKTDISYIKGNISILLRSPDGLFPIQSRSPVRLSPIGEDLAKKMELEKRISRNWGNICNFLDNNLHSKNAYDIQQFCIDTASVHLDKFFDNEDIESFKDFAFNAGKPLIYYGGMIGVMIRDAYFRHRGIDVLDVDKHDPEKQ